MPFNSALSGLQAASSDLRVLGNNIANASTTGFKKSRTDFSDVYAAGALGASSNAIGTGVKLASVSQQFTQGTINSADGSLDLAINGTGFFVLNDSGSVIYSRAGAFGVDKNGFIANSERQQLTGFVTDTNGNITGATGALQISTNNLSPKKTDNITVTLNLDASASPPGAAFATGFTPSSPPASTTFNNSTSTKIFDSLGNEHLLTTYFVKAHAENTWRVYMGIDGIDVTPTAEAVPAGPFPALYPSGDASRLASPYTLVFDKVGAYKVPDTANPPQYYGATPITSNDAGLVAPTANILNAITINDFIINGVPIDPVTVADPFSTQAAFGSARAIVTNINAKSTLHGATAVNNPAGNQVELTTGVYDADSSNPLDAGDFVINGVNIIGAAVDRTTLIGLINGQTANTGVRAENGTGATDIRLVADDNRNIHITSDGTNGEVDFANFSITGGGGDNFVHRGSIQLSTLNNEGITIGGSDPGKADFTAGPLAGIIQTSSDPIEVLQWDPNTGAEIHSRIVVDLSTSTQFSASFSINSLDQDGYATGRLTGVDVDTTGIITARYGNGQSLQLGQVALASFSNAQGLQPLGDTTWSETFSSGVALLGAPGTSNLGLMQSGFLEDSNTQLTDELVSLIVAQRNFQASAQTIRTADAVTQTIINIR